MADPQAHLVWDPARRLVIARYPEGTVLTPELWEEQEERLREYLRVAPTVGFVAHADGMAGATLAYRKRAAAFFREHRECTAIALVGARPYVRALGMLFGKATGLRLRWCGSEEEAISWLQKEGLVA